MFGAIIGDLAGSIYEFDQFKKVTPVITEDLIPEGSFISDDTILTFAISDAILSKADYGKKLREYGSKYMHAIPKDRPYFKNMFSPGFEMWISGRGIGNSLGNGAMMRISPVGNLFNTEEEVLKNARLATMPSHNTDFAIKSAQTIALIIFYARQGKTKEEIIKKLDLKIKKPSIKEFNYTCESTIDVCLYSLFNANSFEESIILTLSFGGDTDTNACIVGSMAEVMFGISDELKQRAITKLPKEFLPILKKFEENQKDLEERDI